MKLTFERFDFDEINRERSVREIRGGLSHHFPGFEFVYKLGTVKI